MIMRCKQVLLGDDYCEIAEGLNTVSLYIMDIAIHLIEI